MDADAGKAAAPELREAPAPNGDSSSGGGGSSKGARGAVDQQGTDPGLRVSPSLLTQRATAGGYPAGGESVAAAQQNNPLQVAWRRVLRELSSLPRAIAIMFLIAGLSGLGTLIPQNKSFEYYVQNYPDIPGQKVLGFLSYPVLFTLELDHIYSNWYFYLSLALLAASLAACTMTRQLPVAKVAQRWRFQTTPKGVIKMGHSEVLPSAQIPDLGKVLQNKGYQVFIKAGALYAFKGLAGRLGPIGVHAALLLILGGTSYSGFGGFKGSVMCPEGGDFVPDQFLRAATAISSPPAAASSIVHVDSFDIDYRPDGQVAQFYSTLTLLSDDGEQVQKRISVNDPFRYKGITMYQTDWSLAAVTLKVLNAPPLSIDTAASGAEARVAGMDEERVPFSAPGEILRLPLASLEGKPGIAGRLWGGFLPLEEPGTSGQAPKGISVLARDPQSLVIYDSKGQFVGVRRPNSGNLIEVEGLQLVVNGITGATGLEIKSDPGVPWVYAGFGGLMITTLVSYLSHSQVWACQQGGYVFVSGKSNRALVAFEKEFDEILEAVPELPRELPMASVHTVDTATPAENQ